MIAKYAIALIVRHPGRAFIAWAFLPARYLPGNRARHLRIRLHLRLHPGKGFAHALQPVAALGPPGRAAPLRPDPPLAPAVVPDRRTAPALGLPRPGPLPAPACGSRWRSTCWSWPRHAPIRPPSSPMSSCATPARSSPPPPKPTSTRSPARSAPSIGRVHVFNPQHIGGVASTFCWDPVAGCEDPATAIRRADAFAFAVSQKGVEDGTFWSAKACDYLRGYFCAAALARYDLRTVAAWVAGAEPDVPERILLAAGARQWARTLAELRSEAHKTAATVRMVMSTIPGLHGRPRPGRLASSRVPATGSTFPPSSTTPAPCT